MLRRSSAIVAPRGAFSLDPLLTLSLFWYLLETVVECHYTQASLLPHLDCVLDSTDNVCRSRPPLPSLQYNLLHQKLSLLNCCIEDKRNNAHSEDLSESDDDDPIYFDQYQTPITDDSLSPSPQTPSPDPSIPQTGGVAASSPTEDSSAVNPQPSLASPTVPAAPTVPAVPAAPGSPVSPVSPRAAPSDAAPEPAAPSVKVPLGKGIYNWSGWYLLGSHEPSWIPITKDKDILTVRPCRSPHA